MSTSAPYRFGVERTVRIVVTTGNEIAGHPTTEILGIVRGIVVRSPSIGQGIVGAFKSIGGGNIREYAEVCEGARHDAYVQMLQHAEQLLPWHANANCPSGHSLRLAFKHVSGELRFGKSPPTHVLLKASHVSPLSQYVLHP